MKSVLRTRLGNQTRRVDSVIDGFTRLRSGEVLERWCDEHQCWRNLVAVLKILALAIAEERFIKEVIDDTENQHVLIIENKLIIL